MAPVGDQKRMLAMDGGGILGLISLGALEQIENQLRASEANGDPEFRLRDFFDYFAGTSTGAIIAAGLAIGKSVADLKSFYVDFGDEMFDKASLLKRWRYAYEADNLRDKLREEFSDDTILALQRRGVLSRDKHLLVVTRNVNTDSPWPISTNPAAKYNDFTLPDCNLLVPLWRIVRASTAAPTFFAPEEIDLGGGSKFLFEDGGVTPYNNPAFLLYRMATDPAYRCGWPTGEDRMMLISVGTGSAFEVLDEPNPGGMGLLTTAASVPGRLMRGISAEQDIACRMIGRCVHGAPVDGELDDMTGAGGDREKAFTYARFDVDISEKGLRAMGLGDIRADRLKMDNAAAIPDLLRIGTHLGTEVDLAGQFPQFVGQ